MIKEWSEIQERYDAIKNHKPRASKKLNELGEILSSAYAINPDKADSMWQYIIDLNVADDITYSKFYIAQVFNKLSDRMKPEEATAFIGMNPERLQMMIMYGYDGGTLWKCLDTLMRGYIPSGDVDSAMVCVDYFYDKFGGINSGYPDVSRVAGNVATICADYIVREEYEDTAAELLVELGESENDDVNSFVEIIKAINGIGGPFDYDQLLDSALENRHPTEFFDLLWLGRDDIDAEDLRDKWVEYVQDCDEDEVRPYNYINEDEENYCKSKLKFYVDLEKDADELLEYYFNRSNLYGVEKGVIWAWIESEDWDRFIKYLAQTVMCTPEESFEWSSIKREFDAYMKATFYDDYIDDTDYYGRSYGKLMQKHSDGFVEALSKISATTVGCDSHESFHEFIKNYIQKKNGNLDILKAVGFDDEVNTGSAEERLKKYVHEFLMSGEEVHRGRNTKYSLIEEALYEELNGMSGGNVHTLSIDITKVFTKALGVELDDSSEDEEFEIDKKLERDYRLAQDDEIAQFYFQHFPQEYMKRKELISACIRKGDLGRAIELIDMMAKTKSNEGYEELNGWGRQNMLTMMRLIDEFAYGKEDRWDFKKDITDEMREDVKQLVYRMMPFLPQKAAVELKKNSLYKIDPKSEDTDEYIEQLLEDAAVYTTFPKPRGKGGAPNINRMSNEFNQCFERLSKMGRLDVVAEIMGKFASVRDILKPVRFDTWMFTMARGLQSGEMIKMFHLNKGIFEAWLSGDDLRDRDILNVARGIADGCTRAEFMEFRNLVISRRGKVDGLDACFKATSENTESQELFDGDTAKIVLDYIDIEGSAHVSFAKIHLLTIAKTRKLDSVRVLKCEINGIDTTDCGFLSEMDEEPTIGYNVYSVNDESQDSLTIYTDFFEENGIDEVKRIVLQFVIMDDNAAHIEELSNVVIELDDSTGEYKVIRKAESLNCFVDCNTDEEDDDDSNNGTSIELSNLLRQFLQGQFNSDDSEEDESFDDEEEFQDITIYDDDHVVVDFCGVEFDAFSEELTLSIWCQNLLEENRRFWISKITVNGKQHATWKLIGEEEDDSSYCDYTVSEVDGIDYEDIEVIEFQIEVDDDDNNAIGTTNKVVLSIDTDEETFKTRIR